VLPGRLFRRPAIHKVVMTTRNAKSALASKSSVRWSFHVTASTGRSDSAASEL
jgi:hypothetical protein